MEAAVSIVQENELESIIEEMNQVLAVLDDQGLQIPAVHLANAIHCLEGMSG